MKTKIIFFLTSCFLSMHVSAAGHWIELGENDENTGYVYSSYSTEDDGDQIVTVRYVRKPGKEGIDVRTGKSFDEAKTKVAVRCSSKQTAEGTERVYYKGKFLSESEEVWDDFIDIEPDTYTEDIVDYVCKT